MPGIQLKSYEFRRERERAWQELERLIKKTESAGVRSLSSVELLRLPSLYRAALSSLSVARSISLDRNVVLYLESLAARAYFCVYGTRTSLPDAVADFFGRQFPAAVRAAAWPILIAGLFMLLGAAVGYFTTAANEDWFYTYVSADYAQGRTPASSTDDLRDVLYDDGGGAAASLYTFATFLFTHNARIGILAFALGFALGAPVIALMTITGLTIGAFAALYAGRGLSVEFWGWLLIHGTTELTAVVLCGGAGLVLGGSLAFPGKHTRLANLAIRGRLAGQVVLGAVAMLFVAGLLEGFGRQLITDATARYAIATGALAAWIWYFTRVGRELSDDDGG